MLEPKYHAGGEVGAGLLEVGGAVVVDVCGVVLPVTDPCEDAVFVVE